MSTAKDQTYFLHQLGQNELASTLFPLGEMHKPEVRSTAAELGLVTAAKKDSTGICFIGERDFRTFLSQYLPMRTGEMRTPDGALIGEHPGVYYFTIGQREGLYIGGQRGYAQAPWFVVGKDVEQNILYVDQCLEQPLLDSRHLRSETMHWIQGAPPAKQFDCQAQTRYRQQAEDCTVRVLDNGTLDITFAGPQRAVTNGQSVVLYQGDICLGGAVIDSSDAVMEYRLNPQAREFFAAPYSAMAA